MTHGLTIVESAAGPRPVAEVSMAVIGLVATATAANGAPTTALNAAFPVNTPVLVTDAAAAAAAAGTGGTLKAALTAIGEVVKAPVIVVRVLPGNDTAATNAAVIGADAAGVKTGMQALLSAEALLGVRPRIIGAPGLDTQAVTTALAIVANKLNGMTYAAGVGATLTDAITYRDNFAAPELMLIWPDTSATAGDAIARALAMRARIDQTIGWHKTISNVAIPGVSTITKHVSFDLLDPSCDAALLNDADVTTIVRTSGFRFWGNRTCADETHPEYSFESAVRTKQALRDVIASVVAPFLDSPMTIGLIKDLLETANAAARNLVRQGRLIGAEFFFDADQNTADQLAAGRPTFRFMFTPVAPLENPTVQLVITDFYYSGFADQVT